MLIYAQLVPVDTQLILQECACLVWLIAEYVRVLPKLSAFHVVLVSICLHPALVLPARATVKVVMPTDA